MVVSDDRSWACEASQGAARYLLLLRLKPGTQLSGKRRAELGLPRTRGSARGELGPRCCAVAVLDVGCTAERGG
eukprot:3715808-Prymnesium_polylepis.3